MAPSTRSSRFDIIPEAYRIAEAIRDAGGRPILVGGWVRDSLLEIPHTKDFDIEVFALPLGRLRKILSGFGPVHMVGRHFGVLKLTTPTAEYDVSIPRRESNIGKGHKGFAVKTDPDMTFPEASGRRDFTINAMGFALLDGELLDPHGGRRDLEKGVLRHVGPAFAEDPLRVLRALQFGGRFGFTIAPETLALCRTLDLNELPRERVWEEVKKLLLASPRPSQGLAWAEPLGVLAFMPELKALHEDTRDFGRGLTPIRRWKFTLDLLDQAARLRHGDPALDRVFMTAALCFCMEDAAGENQPGGGGAITSFLNRLTNETGFADAVRNLVAEMPKIQHLYDHRDEMGAGEIRRLALRIDIPIVLRAAMALHRALHGDRPFQAGAWLEIRSGELGVWHGPPQPLLNGRHLQERGLAPGREMGRLLREAFEHQLDGAFTTAAGGLQWLDDRLNVATGKRPAPRGDSRKGGGKKSGANGRS